MTEATDLQNNATDSISEFNYFSDQIKASYTKTQDDLKKMLMSADSMQAVMFALMNVLPDCIDQLGSYLGQNGGMLDVQASLSSYVSHMQTYFAKGGNIAYNSDSNEAGDYLQEMQDFYKLLNDPSTPLSKEDRSGLLDSLNSIATAYGDEAKNSTATFTPMDLSAGDIATAQTKWASQANGSTTNSNPTGGKEDGNYNAVNMGFQAMNTQLTALNNSLTTQQKVWSDLLDQFQGTEKDAQQYITGVNSVSVNNEIKAG